MSRSFHFFDADRCTACGTCLERCVYLPYRGDAARAAREAIRGGSCPDDVLNRCVSCYACDAFCPNELRPYEAILEYWNDRYAATGLPERARFLMPESRPNFRTHAIDRLPPARKEQVRGWAQTDGRLSGTVLYPGCNLLTLPHLADAPALKGVPIVGSLDDCCGEMYFRMGLFDEVERIAAKRTAYYAAHDIDEMLFVCPACYNMFTHVLPEQFGARFAFRTRFVTDLLIEHTESREPPDAPSRPIAVHDSCHARVMGDAFLQGPREVLRRMGFDPVDATTDLADGLCCGIAAGCSRQSPIDIVRTAREALIAAKATGADRLATYCGGCLLVLAMAARTVPGAPRPVHLLELAAERAPGAGRSETRSRAFTTLLGVARHALPSIFSRGRFRIS